MLSRASQVGILAVGTLLFASVGHADSIAVVNGDFDTLPTGGLSTACDGTPPGCSYEFGSVPGWTQSGPSGFSGGGEFRPGTDVGITKFFDSLPNGNPIVGFSNGATLSQTVGTTVEDGVTYTLQVALGERNDYPGEGSAELLLSGGGGTVTIPCVGPAPTKGNWSTCTATFTGTAAEIGDSITIELLSSGDQGDFDNVTLTDSVDTPEPSSLLLIGSGLLGLLGLAKRKISQLA
jgi:hypothetical protein